MKYYTVYLNKNEKVVAFGDAKQCAEQMHLTNGAASFYAVTSRCKAGKIKKYTIICEKVENKKDIKEVRNRNIYADYKRGLKVKEICKTYNLSPTAVRTIIQKNEPTLEDLLAEWDEVVKMYKD